MTTDPYGAQPWLRLYARGQANKRIEAAETIPAAWARQAREHRDTDLIHYFDRNLTYGAVDRASDALAHWLRLGGIGIGDRVFIALQNIPEFFISVVATWKAGALPVLGNPMYRRAELETLFEDCSPRLVICHSGHVDAAEAIGQRALLVVVADETSGTSPSGARRGIDFDTILAVHAAAVTCAPCAQHDDIGLLLYTSGTTGIPKGAQLTHRNLAFAADLSRSWWGIDQSSRLLSIAPLFHITGFVLNLCLPILAGASVILTRRFEPATTLAAIARHQPSWTIGAATAFTALLNHEDAPASALSSFRDIYSGGAPVPPMLVDAFEARFGIRLKTAYGMTETTAPTHAAPRGSVVPVDAVSGALAIGVPMNGVDARIVDDNGGLCPIGVPGELIVRGPQIMLGYRNRPEETADVLENGWMRTGDVATMDERGWFYLVDRKKDVIIASGFKVWPREVEDLLYAHEAVREAAVIGVPDQYRGETVRAFVSLRRGAQASEAQLIAFCRERLAAYKVPRAISFLPELPKTASGKITRHMLRHSRETEL